MAILNRPKNLTSAPRHITREFPMSIVIDLVCQMVWALLSIDGQMPVELPLRHQYLSVMNLLQLMYSRLLCHLVLGVDEIYPKNKLGSTSPLPMSP